jgi:hypothetical protein
MSLAALSAQDAHLEFEGQLKAVIFAVQGQADFHGVLEADAAEISAGADFYRPDAESDGGTGDHAQFVPDLAQIGFVQAYEGQALGRG